MTLSAQTTGMLKGYPLYVRPGMGPIGCFLYGPFGAIAYIPAALASKSPTIDMLLGSGIAVLCFFLPAAWFIRQTGAGRLHHRTDRRVQLLCRDRSQLRDAGVHVQLDSRRPACFGTGGVRADADNPSPLCSDAPSPPRCLCAAMAIWSKQTLLPLLVALPLVGFFLRGWRAAVLDALMILGFVVAFGVLFVLIFDPRAMLFEMVIEPSRHPRGSVSDVVKPFFEEVWPMLLLLAGALVVRGRESADPHEELAPAKPLVPAAVIVAVILLPGGILGWIKAGGEPNNAALCTYFLLLAACGVVAQCQTPGILSHRADATRLGTMLCALFAAEVSIHAVFADHMLTWRIGLARHVFNNGSELAYRYERAHPGEAYFPWNPNAVLLASGKLYHFDYAAYDRMIANYRPGNVEVQSHLPAKMQYIAYPPHIVPSMEMMELIPGYDRRVELPELPGLLIYTRKETE